MPYSNDTKPNGSYTNDTKPSASYTNETKPNGSYTNENKGGGTYTNEILPGMIEFIMSEALSHLMTEDNDFLITDQSTYTPYTYEAKP